jgi:branched-chain amino acid aminotransferase
MFWIEDGLIAINPDSTRFALVLERMPLPDPAKGFSACLSPYRRPGPEQAPTHAKASCLYPLAMLAVTDAKARGFDNAVMCDPIGNVAELTAQNLMIVRDGVVHTPVPNGTFLNGITRQRVVGLLRDAGVTVHERTIRPAELLEADEIFSTGNHGKGIACTRYEQRALPIGPIATRARELYWQFAHAGTSAAARA